MASLRVFVSSTCYDLEKVRKSLRLFIKQMGFEPIMSDYSDVTYDPRKHTHTSCVDEVQNSDILVLIIGGRFGGKAIPDAHENIQFDKLSRDTSIIEYLKKTKSFSITQLEVLKAIEESIPVYTFIKNDVWVDHEKYQKNKSKGDEGIKYYSIDKQEYAGTIFEFINYIRHRNIGNNIHVFNEINDIRNVLKKQWSGYFQKLLQEQRYTCNQNKEMKIFPKTNIPHKEFNDILNNKIASTKEYIYMGDKAKYTAFRLKEEITKTNPKLIVKVLLPDFRDIDLFETRILALKRTNRTIGITIDDMQMIKNEQLDVLKSIYLLTQLIDRYDISVYLNKEIPLFRADITDDFLAFSFIPSLIDGNYYPVTLSNVDNEIFREPFHDYICEVIRRSEEVKLEEMSIDYLISMGRKYISEEIDYSILKSSELVIGKERNGVVISDNSSSGRGEK